MGGWIYALAVLCLTALLVYASTGARPGLIWSWVKWLIFDLPQVRRLPTPPMHWLWGHLDKVGATEASIRYMESVGSDAKDCIVIWRGPCLPAVMLGNEKGARIYLRRADGKAMTYKYFEPWIGDGLLTTKGAKWKRHRRMLTPAFHYDILKQYISVYNEVSQNLLEIWGPLAGSGESVEITEYTSLYTLDVLLRCIYSNNSNCLVEKDKVPYVQSVKELMSTMEKRVNNPIYLLNWVFYNSSLGRSYLRNTDIVHRYSEAVIQQRRNDLLQGTNHTKKPDKKTRLDFLDILLSATDENGDGLTDLEIREEADTFMFEGHDTTASALTWTLYCLALHADHQQMCRNEIRELLSGRDTDDNITWEDLPKLSYTTMCIKESLRLYPSVPAIGRELEEDMQIGDCSIPKGIDVWLDINVLHHNPHVWEAPEVFDPLRFTIENSKKMDPFAYVPFAAGPRNCIGQNFALHELKITVAHILNKFNLEVDTSHPVERYAIGILKARYGIKLKLELAID